jgi:hypothetical protein
MCLHVSTSGGGDMGVGSLVAESMRVNHVQGYRIA